MSRGAWGRRGRADLLARLLRTGCARSTARGGDRAQGPGAPGAGSGLNGWRARRLFQRPDNYKRWAAATYLGGEAMPAVDISFGPDQFSAFLGAPLVLAGEEQTSWTTPSVRDWSAARFQLDETPGGIWQRLLAFLRAAAERGQGRYLVNRLDLHSPPGRSARAARHAGG